MKAIETIYNGYRFRSRLEARWAVFFDALGIEYDYEPEGFELDNGMRYLPDFKVKCYGTRGDYEGRPFDLYVEVKGELTEGGANKIKGFAGLPDWERQDFFGDDFFSKDNFGYPLLVVSNIPNVQIPHDCVDSSVLHNYDQLGEYDVYPYNYETIDGDYFAAYPAATEDGRFYLMGDDSNYINDWDLDRVMKAYQMARKARFEFGE